MQVAIQIQQRMEKAVKSWHFFLAGRNIIFANNFVVTCRPNLGEYLEWQSLFKEHACLAFYSRTCLLSDRGQ